VTGLSFRTFDPDGRVIARSITASNIAIDLGGDQAAGEGHPRRLASRPLMPLTL
jgi:hypothetical protein